MSRSTKHYRPSAMEPIRDPKHIMTFGKYKGFSVEDVMEINAQYLLWLHDNTDFEMHADLYDACEEGR